MNKFFFYPCWQYEKVEAFLARMEAEGYRLVSVKCGYWFRFKACKPKEVRYFLPHSVLKYYGTDNHVMYNCLNAVHGQRVHPISALETEVYRITKETADLYIAYTARRSLLKRGRKQNIGLAILFVTLTLGALLCGIFEPGQKAPPTIFGLYAGGCIISLGVLVYNIIGLIRISNMHYPIE